MTQVSNNEEGTILPEVDKVIEKWLDNVELSGYVLNEPSVPVAVVPESKEEALPF